MSESEMQTERLIFIAILKNLSEHSTFLTGELKLKLKQDFNVLVKQADHLINDLEYRLNDQQKAYIQEVTDVYHNINITLRTGAREKYKQLLEQEA